MLPNIEAGTKGEELKKNLVGDMTRNQKTALGKTQAVDGNRVHKDSENLLSKQVNTPSGKRRSVLDGHIPRVTKDRTGDYITYPSGITYPALVEYLKKEPDHENHAQLGRHLLTCVRSRIKHQIYQYKEIFDILRRTKYRRDICGVPEVSNVMMAALNDVLASSNDSLESSDEKNATV